MIYSFTHVFCRSSRLSFSSIRLGYLTTSCKAPWYLQLPSKFLATEVLVPRAYGAWNWSLLTHYSDVMVTTMASQFNSITVVYSTVYSDADQWKHQNAASLAFMRGIHRWPVNSPHKGPVTRKMFRLMTSSWTLGHLHEQCSLQRNICLLGYRWFRTMRWLQKWQIQNGRCEISRHLKSSSYFICVSIFSTGHKATIC